jgi:protein-tyrosine phosphatase
MVKKNINVLFVCTGNLCRSPMAEYLLRSRLKPATPWMITSAGLSAADGLPASQTAIGVMAGAGVDISSHRSRSLTKDLVDEATIILVMTNAHSMEIKNRFPDASDRVHLLAYFGKNKLMEISDPIGCSVEFYHRTLCEITDCIGGLIRYLKAYERSR